MREYIHELTSLTHHILETNEHKHWYSNNDTAIIRGTITSICELFKKQEESKTLNSRQRQLATAFDGLKELLKSTNVSRNIEGSIEVYPYWTILNQNLDLSNEDGNEGCEN